MEWLEERQLLTWVATFVNSTGALTIQGVGTSSDTGVLKVDPNSGEILLDGNNSGNFADTGANLATINSTIQIQAGTTINSNFIIDNNAGAFFEAPANFPANAPMFNYTGSSALDPNDSLTIRGTAGVANTFEVALSAGSNQVANGTTTGLAGVPPKAGQPEGVLLAQPPNQLNQRNELLVTFGPDPNVPNSTGITGHLILDGMSSGTNSQLYIDDAGAILNPSNPGTPSSAGAASDWTLNGNTITGPQLLTPTSPPTPTPPPGTAGNITYANMDGLHFNDTVGGEHLFVNSVATNTFASDAAANTTVVNYKQPLAFPFSLQGSLGGKATLDIVGAANGNNSFYVDSHTVALAPTGTKPQYNTPFTHLGADLTYTVGSLANLNVSGNGGNNIFNVQVPPTLIAPYTSDVLPANLTVYGGSLPPVLAGTQSPPVTPGTSNLLRVLGNGPGPLTTGADNITVQDLAANNNGTNAGNVIQMSGIAGVVIYGEGGNDALTNASVGNPKTGQPAVSALLIGGDGNDTLTGGGGSDMMLGGGGQNTLISKTSGTVGAKMTTNYFFPHQDQFGNIYDPLLNPSDGDTTSVVTGAGGNQVVVTGAVDPLASEVVDPTTGLQVGDLDTGNLSNSTTGGGGGGGGNALGVSSFPTVPPTNVTAPLYMATPALTALEQALGISKGPYPANQAALLEFGGNLNLRTQFASPAAFVGRAYNDFMLDRGGSGTFGSPTPGSSVGGGTSGGSAEGGALVAQPEIQFWVGQMQQGLSVQSMQALLLASDELRQTLPGADMWVRNLYQVVTGNQPTTQQLQAATNILNQSDTSATRYAIALSVLNSPAGQTAEIKDAYANVVPGGGAPSPTDLAAIQADLNAGQTLPQVAQIMGQSGGNYLSYEIANDVGVVGFIGTLYQQVLHRGASAGELSYWTSVRAAGASDNQIAQTILNSPEAKSFVVAAAYQRYLHRGTDPGGLNYWVSLMGQGLTDEQFVADIVASPEYYANHGSTSAGFVTGLYMDVLQRPAPPSQPEIDYWVSQLAQSSRGAVQARADVVLGFEQSPEYRTMLINGWYQSFDGRAPTSAELSSALQQFVAGATDEQVEAQILAARASG